MAWAGTISLDRYMKNKGYWTNSTYAQCNAGNIVYTNSTFDHVMVITLNDTVTHRYSAHTADEYNRVFGNVSSYMYRAIKVT